MGSRTSRLFESRQGSAGEIQNSPIRRQDVSAPGQVKLFRLRRSGGNGAVNRRILWAVADSQDAADVRAKRSRGTGVHAVNESRRMMPCRKTLHLEQWEITECN